ncbi:hypothetical protein PpBr36_01422 [Pyricularia pennisetigena]|uniref:hypothetical protein n=1 Tax=Pyricularia pennisetigena TaxID=1578925 RepID=UPI00115210A3|nr:hypothetical protein PpBr36_01422 [Pyricularia pennisetigena]TLS28608.1 hypothetical protein PpBr36_01422 [Pyricularia pennisetigena]
MALRSCVSSSPNPPSLEVSSNILSYASCSAGGQTSSRMSMASTSSTLFAYWPSAVFSTRFLALSLEPGGSAGSRSYSLRKTVRTSDMTKSALSVMHAAFCMIALRHASSREKQASLSLVRSVSSVSLRIRSAPGTALSLSAGDKVHSSSASITRKHEVWRRIRLFKACHVFSPGSWSFGHNSSPS